MTERTRRIIERKIKNAEYWIEDFKNDGFSTQEDISKAEASRDEWQAYLDANPTD